MVNNQWLQSYIQLAFRIDKAIRAISVSSPFVDCYYGPPEWKESVATEDITLPTIYYERLQPIYIWDIIRKSCNYPEYWWQSPHPCCLDMLCHW